MELLAALIRYGISDWEMIERGIDESKKPWLPTPDEFAMSCKPSLEEYGLPTPDQAYREAGNQAGRHPQARRWTNPAVYVAACEVGFSFLKTEVAAKGFHVFREAYSKVCKRVMAGEKLELPKTERLEKKEERVLSKEERQAQLAKIKQDLEL